MLDYGRPANPEAFIIARLLPLNLPVGPERDQETPLPCYVVTAVAGRHDKYVLNAVVSVHSMADTRAAASTAAWDADNMLVSVTPGDTLTMADGRPAGAWIDCVMSPVYANYADPLIKRYAARYDVALRFTRVE